MRPRIMGFFKYDLFPYVVGFEISEIKEDGSIKVKDVGCFKASSLIAIRTRSSGERLLDKLCGIRIEYENQRDHVASESSRRSSNCSAKRLSNANVYRQFLWGKQILEFLSVWSDTNYEGRKNRNTRKMCC